MRSDGKRAVIASAFRQDADKLRGQLIPLGFDEIICASDGMQALGCVKDFLPDVLIADAVLPQMDGFALAERVSMLPLPVLPGTVLLSVPGMRVRGNGLCAVLEKPAQDAALKAAIERLTPERRPVNEVVCIQAEAILKSLGIPEHPGREYLIRAVWIVRQDVRILNALGARLYPAIADSFGRDSRHVERAIRHVIDVAWRSEEMEAQHRIFGDTIDARRGNPTCGEMIAQIADILRWEGNA